MGLTLVHGNIPKYSSHLVWMHEILCEILSVPQIIVMDLNYVIDVRNTKKILNPKKETKTWNKIVKERKVNY